MDPDDEAQAAIKRLYAVVVKQFSSDGPTTVGAPPLQPTVRWAGRESGVVQFTPISLTFTFARPAITCKAAPKNVHKRREQIHMIIACCAAVAVLLPHAVMVTSAHDCQT